MIQKLLTPILFILLFSFNSYSQKNEIVLSHVEMKSWSSVEVQSESPGDYLLKIIGDDKKLISSKTFSISNQKKAVFKYNFGNFKKGIYTFQLLKNEKIIYSKKYTKK